VSHKTNDQIAIDMLAGMKSGVLDDSIMTDDITWWMPGEGVFNKAQYLALGDAVRAMLVGDYSLTVRGVTAQGDRVAIEAESYGPLSNGKIYNNFYHFLFLFRDGRIHQVKAYYDSLYAARIFESAMGENFENARRIAR
jgi:ketosteroid isomerase-like protein